MICVRWKTPCLSEDTQHLGHKHKKNMLMQYYWTKLVEVKDNLINFLNIINNSTFAVQKFLSHSKFSQNSWRNKIFHEIQGVFKEFKEVKKKLRWNQGFQGIQGVVDTLQLTQIHLKLYSYNPCWFQYPSICYVYLNCIIP